MGEKTAEQIKTLFEETIPKYMKEIDSFLGDGWLVGDKMTIADFWIGTFYTNIINHDQLEEKLKCKDERAKFKTDFPKFAAYGERFAKENANWIKTRPLVDI
jgi:glutathione S-transferase